MDLIAIVPTGALCAGLALGTLVLGVQRFVRVERKLAGLANHPGATTGELRRARLIRQRSLRG